MAFLCSRQGGLHHGKRFPINRYLLMERRVVITGMGIYSHIGVRKELSRNHSTRPLRVSASSPGRHEFGYRSALSGLLPRIPT